MRGKAWGRGWEKTTSMVKETVYTNLVIVETLTSGMMNGKSNSGFHANLLITLNILLEKFSAAASYPLA